MGNTYSTIKGEVTWNQLPTIRKWSILVIFPRNAPTPGLDITRPSRLSDFFLNSGI